MNCPHCNANVDYILAHDCPAIVTQRPGAERSESGFVTCSELVCDAPPTTPDSEGWWWVRHDKPLRGEWQPVIVETVGGELCFQKQPWQGWMPITTAAIVGMVWGGRCAVPGASHTAGMSRGERVALGVSCVLFVLAMMTLFWRVSDKVMEVLR